MISRSRRNLKFILEKMMTNRTKMLHTALVPTLVTKPENGTWHLMICSPQEPQLKSPVEAFSMLCKACPNRWQRDSATKQQNCRASEITKSNQLQRYLILQSSIGRALQRFVPTFPGKQTMHFKQYPRFTGHPKKNIRHHALELIIAAYGKWRFQDSSKI